VEILQKRNILLCAAAPFDSANTLAPSEVISLVQNSLELVNNKIHTCRQDWRNDSLLRASLRFLADTAQCEKLAISYEQVDALLLSFIRNTLHDILHYQTKGELLDSVQETASYAIVHLLQTERIGKHILRDLSRDIGRIVSECKTFVATNEEQLYQSLENIFFGFWILEKTVQNHISDWKHKEECCCELSEQLNKLGAEGFPIICCYTFRLLSELSRYCREEEERCKQIQFAKLSALMAPITK